MNKKILIGSILVFIILLLMPSIPAIQKKIIEDRTYSDLFEQLDVKDIKEKKKMDLIRRPLLYAHPLLYAIVILLAKFRWSRCLILAEISFDSTGWPPDYEVYHPILFLRCIWLLNTFGIWCIFWINISDTLGWNWDDIASIVIQ